MFRATAGLRATCTRLLIEAGTYTNPTDLAAMQQALYPVIAAGAIADALVVWRNGQAA